MDTSTIKTELNYLSGMLKVIAEPKRLEILSLLLAGTHCNCEIGEKLNLAPNLISHHLRVLNEAGLIETERDAVDARWIYYSINSETLDGLLVQLQDFLDTSKTIVLVPNCGPGAGPCESSRSNDL
jgi:ArsR family transcriptional regulator